MSENRCPEFSTPVCSRDFSSTQYTAIQNNAAARTHPCLKLEWVRKGDKRLYATRIWSWCFDDDCSPKGGNIFPLFSPPNIHLLVCRRVTENFVDCVRNCHSYHLYQNVGVGVAQTGDNILQHFFT